MLRTRSLLFAPGSNARILDKVFECGSDAVDLDMEDAVPIAEKERARGMVAEAIDRRRGQPGPRIVVQVDRLERARGLPEQSLRVISSVDTAHLVLDLPALARSSARSTRSSRPPRTRSAGRAR
jgi:citrate lyase subunit beta/citryl-CoA lyase